MSTKVVGVTASQLHLHLMQGNADQGQVDKHLPRHAAINREADGCGFPCHGDLS